MSRIYCSNCWGTGFRSRTTCIKCGGLGSVERNEIKLHNQCSHCETITTSERIMSCGHQQKMCCDCRKSFSGRCIICR